MHLWQLINTFHKKHPKKPTATSPPLDFISPMAWLTIAKESKQKCGRPSKEFQQKK